MFGHVEEECRKKYGIRREWRRVDLAKQGLQQDLAQETTQHAETTHFAQETTQHAVDAFVPVSRKSTARPIQQQALPV